MIKLAHCSNANAATLGVLGSSEKQITERPSNLTTIVRHEILAVKRACVIH